LYDYLVLYKVTKKRLSPVFFYTPQKC
jgi:hypothetical protein